MKVNNVAFDLDGTLVDLMTVIEEISHDNGYEILNNGKYRVEVIPYLDQKDIWSFFETAFAQHKRINAYEGAEELLEKLYEMTGEPPKIITSRPPRAASETHALTNRLFKTPHEVIFVESSSHKYLHLHGIDFFVDDRRKTAKELSRLKKLVYVPRRDYNHMVDDVGYITFYDDIPELMKFYLKDFVKEVF